MHRPACNTWRYVRKSNMSDRHLDITKFSYSSYGKLKKNLGEFDAVVECNEIAIREFIEKSQGEEVGKYIQELSAKHKIKVDEVNFVKFGSRIRHYYVASVFQQSEQFLKDFKEECKQYVCDTEWGDIEKGETKLQYMARNTNTTFDSDIIEMYEYYRLIRNYMAHTDRDIKELKIRYKKIEKNENRFLNDMHLDCFPNSLENIDFNDFLLLTNIVKHIAYILCQNAKPSNKRIAEILFNLSKENNKATYKGLKKLKNNIPRYENALKSFAISSFGRFSSKDMEEVILELKCLLA